MTREARLTYRGPALFSIGFRPFFLAAIGFATVIVPLWLAVYLGYLEVGGPFAPVDWHIHEMLFGYTAAALSGFLFTAIPNWTGRLPVRGWPLATLVALWVAGRLAMLGVFGSNTLLVALIDCSFLAAISIAIIREIVAGENWRNLMVVGPVLVFLCANILFHAEVTESGISDYSRRLSLAVPSFLVMLIGGRIIPSFTRNWLAKRGPGPLPTPFNRLDAFCLLLGAGALIAWVGIPEAIVTPWILMLASALHVARLSRWQGHRTLASPLLLALHIAYFFIPLSLLSLALGAETAGLHLLGVGGLGGMTLAVMIRATLGHTGRALVIGRAMGLAFALIIFSGVVRSAAPYIDGESSLYGLIIAASLWSIGFAIVSVRLGPVLWSPKA